MAGLDHAPTPLDFPPLRAGHVDDHQFRGGEHDTAGFLFSGVVARSRKDKDNFTCSVFVSIGMRSSESDHTPVQLQLTVIYRLGSSCLLLPLSRMHVSGISPSENKLGSNL